MSGLCTTLGLPFNQIGVIADAVRDLYVLTRTAIDLCVALRTVGCREAFFVGISLTDARDSKKGPDGLSGTVCPGYRPDINSGIQNRAPSWLIKLPSVLTVVGWR